MEWVTLWLQTFSVIFAIVDPFGYVPIFLSMTSKDSVKRQREMLKKACLTAFVVLLLFTFVGQHILGFFGISLPALRIAGGLILLLIGFEMVKVIPVAEKLSSHEQSEGVEKDDISIVPLAIPMLAGPASIATVIVLSSKAPTVANYLAIVTSIIVTLAFTYLILRSSTKILQLIGLTGLKVLTRVMGFVLCAMAIQFMIDGYLAVTGGNAAGGH